MLGAKLGVRTIKRLILLAQARFEPEKLADPADKRWVRIGADTDDQSGHSWLDGCLDTPDALDLEAALRQISADLADDSGGADLDLRRAQALGVMARRVLGQPALPDCGGREARTGAAEVNDGAGGTPGENAPGASEESGGPAVFRGDDAERAPSTGPVPRTPALRRPGRPVTIYLHFDAAQLSDGCGGLGEVGSTGQLVTMDEIRRWCGTAGSITVRPVIDLNGTRATRGYQPTDVMREQIALRDLTCVFPHCDRVAHPIRRPASENYSHDADHIAPYDSGGETSTDNLACLCRLHHLLKTHTDWHYEMTGPGEYLWKSPAGHQYLRTATGTSRLEIRRKGRPEAA